jgi:ribosome recycling factor
MDQKLNQLSNITIMDAQTIKIEPWDKSIISNIEK